VVDGLQFLRLLGRTHPGQPVVMLTGLATEANRKICLENGAALFLEKPTSREGFASVFAALDALAGVAPQSGFRGMIRRVGLQEVLQLECLGRKSSVLEIFTGKVRGRIFICDGSVIHAETGLLQGEVALYGLLALQGGEFNLLPFTEPARRTITGQWEFLLMEAARLNDEGRTTLPGEQPQAEPTATAQPAAVAQTAEAEPEPAGLVEIQEVVLCSGSGEVLYEWACPSIEDRVRLLGRVEQQAAQVSSVAPVGRFDRLEILTNDERIVCRIQSHLRLFVRRAGGSPPAP
jgi:CheY-like chemotaxis protein